MQLFYRYEISEVTIFLHFVVVDFTFCHYKLQIIDFVHYVYFFIFDPFDVLVYDIYIFMFLLNFC